MIYRNKDDNGIKYGWVEKESYNHNNVCKRM